MYMLEIRLKSDGRGCLGIVWRESYLNWKYCIFPKRMIASGQPENPIVLSRDAVVLALNYIEERECA